MVNYKAVDVMKFVCAILVVVIHTSPFGKSELSFIINQNIARVVVPLFFIASGYLVWGKYKENKNYIYKYIKNLFKIIIVWNIIYLPFNIYLYNKLGKSLIQYLRDFLFNGTYLQLWYLNALLISIILIVFLNRYFRIERIGVLTIGLYIIGLLGSSYEGVFKNNLKDFLINSYCLIFENTRNGFLFGAIFITIGILIKEYNLNSKLEKRKNIIFILIMFIVLFIETYSLRKFFGVVAFDMLISLVFLAPLIFILTLNTNQFKRIENTKVFRNLSFWIYCVHGLFIPISNRIFNVNEINNFIFVLGSSIISYFIFEKIKIIFKQKVLVGK